MYKPTDSSDADFFVAKHDQYVIMVDIACLQKDDIS